MVLHAQAGWQAPKGCRHSARWVPHSSSFVQGVHGHLACRLMVLHGDCPPSISCWTVRNLPQAVRMEHLADGGSSVMCVPCRSGWSVQGGHALWQEALLARAVSACGPQGAHIKPWASSLTRRGCNDASVATGQHSRADGALQANLLKGPPRSCALAASAHLLQGHSPALIAETSALAAQHGPPRQGQVGPPCTASNMLTWPLRPHSLAHRLAPALGLRATARHPPEHQQLPGCQRTAGRGKGPGEPQLPPPFQQSPGQQCSTCHWWLSL